MRGGGGKLRQNLFCHNLIILPFADINNSIVEYDYITSNNLSSKADLFRETI